MLDAQEVTGSSPVSPTFSMYIKLKKIAIINYRAYRESIGNLLNSGYKVILVKPFYRNKSYIASHADLQIFTFYKKEVIIAPNLSSFTVRQLVLSLNHNKNIILGNSFLREGYPKEVFYNAIVVDKYLIGNLKYLDNTLIEIGRRYGFSLVHVNQGYVRCTTIPIDKKTVITEDRGVSKKLRSIGINVKFLQPGFIDIDGYDYGFLAGSSGIDNNVFYVNGDIDLYPYKSELENYLKRYHIKIKSLAPGKRLKDIGSILFV